MTGRGFFRPIAGGGTPRRAPFIRCAAVLEAAASFVPEAAVTCDETLLVGDVPSVFAQDGVRLRTSWIVNAGVRHDDYESLGGTTNPRAAGIGGADRATTLKMLCGTGVAGG